MSIDFSFSRSSDRFSASSDDADLAKFSKPLSGYQADCLDALLFQKDFYLKNKRNGFLTPAYKAHQLFQAVISAYVLEYHKFSGQNLGKIRLKELMERFQLSVGMAIKGSTAAAIFTQKPICEQNDLDTVVYFNSLPHESSFAANDIFYRKVAYEAVLSLLKVHFKDEADRFNPVDFFENLILFSDNSVFLVSLANIDFAFPVPKLSADKSIKASSTFLNESLRIKIPIFNGKVKRGEAFEVGSEFDFDFETIQRVFLQKIIVIPQPEAILYNGLERLAYSISKGWTVLDKEPVYVLIRDFSKRAKEALPVYRVGGLFGKVGPLDRLMGLVIKKEAYPTFALNIFLNAYRLMEVYTQDFSEEGEGLKLEFHRAFNDPKWKAIFPPFINEFLVEDKLKFLISYVTLKGHLTHFFPENKVRNHFYQRARVFGAEGKQIGYFIADALDLDGCLRLYYQLVSTLRPDISLKIFADFFFPFNGLALSVEDVFSVLYLIRSLNQTDHDEIEINELEKLLPKVMSLFANKTILIKNFFRRETLELFFSRNLTIIKANTESKLFLLQILESPENFHLFPLFYLVFQGEIQDLEEFLSNIKMQVTEDFLIPYTILLTRDDNELSIEQNKNLIETFLKVFHEKLSFDLIILLVQKYSRYLIKEQKFEIKEEKLWIQLVTKLLVIEKKLISQIIEPFLQNRAFFILFFSHVDLRVYSIEKLMKFFQLAKEMELYEEMHKIILFYPILSCELDPISRMELIIRELSFDGISEKFLDDFLYTLSIDHPILLNLKMQMIIESLSADTILNVVIGILKKRDLFAKKCFRTYLQSKPFQKKLRTQKKEIRKYLFLEKSKGEFPNNLSAELIEVFLGDLSQFSVLEQDVRFTFFCVDFLNLDDPYEINKIILFIEICHQKLMNFYAEDSLKDIKAFQNLCKKTLDIHVKFPELLLPKIWLKIAYQRLFTENSIESLFLFFPNITKELEILEIIDTKLSKSAVPLLPDQIAILINFFEGFTQGLKSLLLHMEKFGITDQYHEVSDQLFHLLKGDAKVKFLKRAIEKKHVVDLIPLWINSIELSFISCCEIVQLLIQKDYEECKVNFIQKMIKTFHKHEDYQNQVYLLFSSLQEHNKSKFFSLIASFFDKLSIVNQTDLLISLNFLHDEKSINLIQKSSFDPLCLGFLVEILNKINMSKILISSLEIQEHLDFLALNTIDSIMRDSKDQDVSKIKIRYLEVYLKKQKILFEGPSTKILERILANITHFEDVFPLLEEAVCSSYSKFSIKALADLFHFKLNSKQVIKGVLKEKYEKIFDYFLTEAPFSIAFDTYKNFQPKLGWSEVLTEGLIFKLICKSIEDAQLENIPNILKLEGWKSFSKIPEKLKKRFFSLIDQHISTTSTTQQLFEIFLNLKVIFPLINSPYRIENTFSELFNKFLQNELFIDDDWKLFKQIYGDILNLKNKTQSAKPALVPIDQELHSLAIKILVDLSINIELNEFFIISEMLLAKSKSLMEKYLEQMIISHPSTLVRFFNEKELGRLNQFIKIVVDFNLVKKFDSPLLLEVQKILYQILESLVKAAAITDDQEVLLGLINVLDIYSSIPKSRRTAIENNYLFESYLLLLQEKNIFLGPECSPFFVIKQMSVLIKQQNPGEFVDDAKPYILEIFKRVLKFFSVIGQGVFSSEILLVHPSEIFFEEFKKEEALSMLNSMIFFLLEEILVPLKDTKIELCHFAFALIKIVGKLNLSDSIVRDKYVDHMLLLSDAYLKKLPERYVYEEKSLFMGSIETFDLFLDWNEKNIQDFVLFNIRRMIYSLITKTIPTKVESWLAIPFFIEKLSELHLYPNIDDKVHLLDMINISVLGVFSLSLSDEMKFREIWKTIISEIFKRYTLIIKGLEGLESHKIPIFRSMRGLIQEALIKFQTSPNFFTNRSEELFKDIPLHDFIHIINVLEVNPEWGSIVFEKKLDYFKIIYSLLNCLHLRKDEIDTIDPVDLEKIYATALSYCKCFIVAIPSVTRIQGMEKRVFLQKVINHLNKILPEKNFYQLLHFYTQIISDEILEEKPSLSILKDFFQLIIHYEAKEEAFLIIQKIETFDKQAYLSQLPEYVVLEKFVESYSSTCTIS